MATLETRLAVEEKLKKLFGEPTTAPSWTPVPGGSDKEFCSFTFPPVAPSTTPTVIVARVETIGTKETVTYTKNGEKWTPRTWLGFTRSVLYWTLIAVLIFLCGVLLYKYALVPGYNFAMQQLSSNATADPAQNAPATPPAAQPQVIVNNMAGPVTPALTASQQYLDEELGENNSALNQAKLNLADAQELVDRKAAQLQTAKAQLIEWQDKLKDAKAENDDDAATMAQTKIDGFIQERDLLQKRLTILERKRDNAKQALATLRSKNRSLLGKPLDEEAIARATEVGTANALKDGLKDLTAAVKNGDKSIADAIEKGDDKIAKAVETSGTKVATAVDNLTKEVKLQNDRLDALNKNILALDGLGKTTADKMADMLNKIEQKKTVYAADPVILKSIADTLEGMLEKMKEKPAPAAPVAPAAPAVSNVAPGQYYAQPCQNQNGYCVRQWGR